MKLNLITLLLAGASLNMARAAINPVAITPNSYTYDIVVEKGALPPLTVPGFLTADTGSGSSLSDSSFFEQGLYSRPGTVGYNLGVPPHNSLLTNINNSAQTFLMPPSYLANDDIQLGSRYNSGTMTLNTPTTATILSVLGTGGGGATTVSFIVTHSDNSTETGSINFPDWFNGGSAVVWGCNGRVGPGGGYSAINTGSANNNVPYLYGETINVSAASPVTQISFTWVSGGHGNIYGVTAKNGTGPWTPVPVGGFNEMTMVPAYPASGPFPVTATMDQGTNLVYSGANMNTWYEQGYDTNAPTTGVPPSGSTFTSLAQPTHHYQMGIYTTNNAILINTNVQTANITIASPAPYTEYAFLTAGANIGGTPMPLTAILQHADGVQETNTFYGFDWFDGNHNGALAWKANGRVQMADRSLNNVSNSTPNFFESYFPLADATSAVTNIVVNYKSASSASASTYILAVSASTTAEPPVITQNPLPTEQAWYVGQTATFAAQSAATVPNTNSWLVESNGTYVPLTDGVDANGSTISGSGTTTLTVSGITMLDATNYEYVIANGAGSVTSTPAALFIKGYAGVINEPNWNNIANESFPVGTPTNILASDGVTTATLTLSGGGANNGYSTGITGDGGNYSLMDGFMDPYGATSAQDAMATISGLTDANYDVYIYCFTDTSRPNNGSDGLPNYGVNGTDYYAPILGASTASTFDSTATAVGGKGFTGFMQCTTYTTNDFTNNLPASSFGNYIKIPAVATSGGEIIVDANMDVTSFRSPINGIQLVSTTTGKSFGINFLGATADVVAPLTPGKPVIDSQVPSNSIITFLSGHVINQTYSVTVDPSSASPLTYQWYNGSTPIPGATNSTYSTIDTNGQVFSVVVVNFVGSVTSNPVMVNSFTRPPLTAYQQAIMNYNPLAYWPLNETNGNIAFDWASTNDGTYTGGYTLGNPGIPASAGMSATVAAGFDGTSGYVNIPVNNLNVTGAVTVVTWAQTPSGTSAFQTVLGHSDQSYRTSFVNSNPRFVDPGPDLIGSQVVNDGNWHLVVGVYDGTTEYLYVDGATLAASAVSGSKPNSSDNVTIAAAPDYLGSRNFKGNIAQCAIIPQALTAAQIQGIYNTLGVAPTVTLSPQTPNVYAGSKVTFTATLGGGSATHIQWYYIDTSLNSNNIANATNTTYSFTAQVAQNGYQYGVTVANAYGAATAATTLTVQTGPAFQISDISPLTGEAYAGAPVVYSVVAGGTAPIYYQWTLNGSPIPGATNSSVTLAAPCGTSTIQVSYTNAQNAGIPIVSSQATLQGDASPTNITFFTNGMNWQVNGSVGSINNNVLTLTAGATGQETTAFYLTPQYVGSFTASFTYLGNGGADGSAFVVQNDPSGYAAFGGGGGELGYTGITNSFAFEFNLYSPNGIGVNVGTGGSTGGYKPTGPVNVGSGDPINTTLNYANGILKVTLQDTISLATFSTNFNLGPVPALLGGNLGYIGFSGADGGISSVQTISNFSFQSAIPDLPLTVSPVSNGSFTVSWSGTDPNYQLQKSASLTSPSWSSAGTATVVNGTAQVSISVSGATMQFYRLTRTTPCGTVSDLQQ